MDKSLTPAESYAGLAEAISASGIVFKREDLHPLGSHKGRSIPHMIDTYVSVGDKNFAISSSGNAALAAALHIHKLNGDRKDDEKLNLDIFIGNHAAPNKVKKLKDLTNDNIRVLIKERPLQALTLATQEGIRSLRQSTDDLALKGYESLAREISMIPDAGAVFVGTSSGTTAQALAQFFIENEIGIQVHIVQTSSCHPIADSFESFDLPDEKSIADAITDITGRRKDALNPLVIETDGRAWCAKNDDIRSAQDLTEKYTGLSLSTNSALSVVGAMQASYLAHPIKGTSVCLICGE